MPFRSIVYRIRRGLQTPLQGKSKSPKNKQLPQFPRRFGSQETTGRHMSTTKRRKLLVRVHADSTSDGATSHMIPLFRRKRFVCAVSPHPAAVAAALVEIMDAKEGR